MREGPACRVLISYAHQSPEKDDQVFRLCELLRENGVDAHIDKIAAEQPQDWPLWTTREIQRADHVLMIASAVYKQRFEQSDPKGDGLGVAWEARLIRNALYRDQNAGRSKFLPVLLPGASPADIPDEMTPESATQYRVTDFTLAGAEPLFRFLTRQPAYVAPALGPVPDLPPLRCAPRAVLNLTIDGGSTEMRHSVALAATGAAGEHADPAPVELDEDGDVREAVVVMAPGTHADVVGAVIRTVHETIRSASRSTAGLQVRIGADVDRAGRLTVGQVAGRLARCAAGRMMHRVRGAPLVIVASSEFRSWITGAPGAFPSSQSYAERPDPDVDGGQCWVAVPGRSVCPPPPRTPDAHTGQDEDAPPNGSYWFPNNRGTVHIVHQRDHGVVHIPRGGDGGRRP